MSKDRQPVRKPRWSLFIAALPAMVFGAIAAAFLWGLFNNDDGLPSTMIGRDIPAFNLPPIEGRGKGLSAADLRGEVSLVNVWASWCVPCRVEMPLLVELAQTDSVPIHGINLKDKPAAARRFRNSAILMTGSVPTALAGLRLTGAFTACRKPL